MGRKNGLLWKLMNLFVILVVGVVLSAGISTYAHQTRVYREECEETLQHIVETFAALMTNDGDEFLIYQKLMLEYSDRILIPYDYNGDYHPAKNSFYDLFNKSYPGKSLGTDVDYMEMSEELKIRYVTYKHEYWLAVFEKARDSFEIPYCYYVVPTGEDLHVYYMIDAVREKKIVDGKEYILLNTDVDQPMESHSHMWQAWNTGEKVEGNDITDNEFGINYAHFDTLFINGEKIGIIGSDMEVARVNKKILINTVRQSFSIGFLLSILCVLLFLRVSDRYLARLIRLKERVAEFSDSKASGISDLIIKDIKGKDELADLSNQIAIMISDISLYMQSLLNKNRELMEAQEKIRVANELANKDALTGIRNKNAYDNEVKKIEGWMENEGFTKFGIVMVDLNFLKVINDNYGHDKGNIAIQKICMIVCLNFSHSPVFRVGGDEFVVVLENTDYERIDILIEQFKTTLEDIANDKSLEPWEKVSAAIGWTKYDPTIDTGVESVFKRADDLMYENKKAMKANRK